MSTAQRAMPFAAALAVAVWAIVWSVGGSRAEPANPAAPVAGLRCPRTVRPLGEIALLVATRLELVDLADCRATQVATGVLPGMRFSADGRWLAYSRSAGGRRVGPVVMPAGGGAARMPLGAHVTDWSWSADGDRLYGVTAGGDLVQGTPYGRASIIAGGLPDANAEAPSPGGGQVAIGRFRCPPPSGGELKTVVVNGGARDVVLRDVRGQPRLAGWSPDGRWLLYWGQAMCSASLDADGWPLDAVPAAGGGAPVRAVPSMLLYPDFLTWCGRRLIAAAGPSRETQLGSALVSTAPPSWRPRTIARAGRLSWVSPTCDPSGRLLAAAAGPSTQDAQFGIQHRSLWLLRPDGRIVRRLTQPPAADLSDESPRFSRDGRWLLFVRVRVVTTGQTAVSRATLELVPAALRRPAATVALLRFTSDDFSYYDHFGWADEIAWSDGR